jgi:hypothetical protein
MRNPSWLSTNKIHPYQTDKTAHDMGHWFEIESENLPNGTYQLPEDFP